MWCSVYCMWCSVYCIRRRWTPCMWCSLTCIECRWMDLVQNPLRTFSEGFRYPSGIHQNLDCLVDGALGQPSLFLERFYAWPTPSLVIGLVCQCEKHDEGGAFKLLGIPNVRHNPDGHCVPYRVELWNKSWQRLQSTVRSDSSSHPRTLGYFRWCT